MKVIGTSKRLAGEFTVPGDKSVSHRSVMLSSLADGDTVISNFSSSADCLSTVDCMRRLGVEINKDGGRVTVKGVGKDGLKASADILDCGNSGTTMRLLSGILAGQPFTSEMSGDASLNSRPMMRVIEPLRLMGAEISSHEGKAPLTISGRSPLVPINYQTPVASAQIKSCVLLAGLLADGETTVTEAAPTRDHTERMLRWLGVEVSEEQCDQGTKIGVNGNAKLKARDINVPSDISSAAFFLVAAAGLPGSSITIKNVGYNATRNGIITVLERLGVDIGINNIREDCNEPVCDISVNGRDLSTVDSAATLSGPIIANIIDELPVISVLGTRLKHGIEVRDAKELRVKESDRINAVVTNLRRMGAVVEEFDDGLRVGRSDLAAAEINSFHDHRIAMAFSIAALFAQGETVINGSDCVNISFPEFFDILNKRAV